LYNQQDFVVVEAGVYGKSAEKLLIGKHPNPYSVMLFHILLS
jgi:hypothetical protein